MAVPFSNTLKGVKVAVTRPPAVWFGGLDRVHAHDLAADLRRMGATLFEVDVERLVLKDNDYTSLLLDGLREFRPDIALALPNGGYGVICTDSEGRNIFRDILQIPTILLWDHGPFQFCSLLLGQLPETPAESTDDAIARFRAALDHPLYIHYSPDKGHAALARALGAIVCQPSITSFSRPGHVLRGGASRKRIRAGPNSRSPAMYTSNGRGR